MTHKFEFTPEPPKHLTTLISDYCTDLCRISALGYMSSAIMHDIGNALTVISGNVQIMQMKRDGLDTDDLNSRLNLIMDQISRIENTIGRVGSFGSRLTGKKAEVNPYQTLNNALFAFKRRTLLDGLDVEFPDEKKQLLLYYDPSILEFIFLEMLMLFINVLKGKGKLRINTAKSSEFWSVSAELEQPSTYADQIKFWKDEKLPDLLIGTLSALGIKGGNVTLYGDEIGVGWKLSFPVNKDQQ